jgi:predicted transcriptional regulator
MKRTIGIKNKDQFFTELEQDWRAIDRGEKIPEPIHRVYFESAEVLSRVLTRQRVNLLKVLHMHGALNVRALAALLQRDYKNVFEDVRILEDAGLIVRDSKKHVLAPYEKLNIELPLTA